MTEKTVIINGYQTPEMVAESIKKHGHYVGCSMLDDHFLNKYYIYDSGSEKVGVEVTFLNGKAVATRNIPASALNGFTKEVQFGNF